MNFPQEYIHFLVHFHGDRDYFECHEILEDYWKKVDSGNKESIWVGLIQLAVSNYHHRRGNFAGAKRTLEKSAYILSKNKEKLEELGIEATILLQEIDDHLARIDSLKPYNSYSLPLSHELVSLCARRSKELGLAWGSNSNMEDHDVVHRHMRRDRSPVIEERQQALKNKRNRRQ
ncbi:DUF309 domain-containing protein [Niallia sp. Krafla_26]|uniref:DUF309 domain-containing protein n=1 Tax=Niallia sp. Krafla_26 TaxID=3064703 RepID=UPI003D174841